MYDEKFIKAVQTTLRFEGRYADDPDDSGGETNFGISKRSYPDLDIRSLTSDQAIAIYYRDFWAPNRYGEIEDRDLAGKVFDLAVNNGPRKTNVMLQLAIRQTGGENIKADGIIGDKTIAAVNTHNCPGWVLDRLRILAVKRYVALRTLKYLIGWINRVLDDLF